MVDLSDRPVRRSRKHPGDVASVKRPLLPIPAVPTPFTIDHDIAELNQTAAQKDTKESSMRRLGQAVDCPQILEYAIRYAPVEEPSFILSRFDECRWKKRWRSGLATGLNAPKNHSRIVYEMVEIIAAELCDNEVCQERVYLHCDRMHP